MTRAEFTSSARMAMATIREHKLRSFRTVLGVIIGTGTVIGVGSIITGLDRTITEAFRSFGPNTIMAFKFPMLGHASREEMARRPLTTENARAIADRCRSCQYVSPYLIADFRTIHKARYKGNDLYQVDVAGTEEGYSFGGTMMKYGRFLGDTD